MSKYIDADTLVSELWRLSNFYETIDKSLFLDNELCGKVIDVIDRQENVEVEPIKHCKPIRVGGSWACSNCDWGLTSLIYSYCPNCGQAIDWSDEDDN